MTIFHDAHYFCARSGCDEFFWIGGLWELKFNRVALTINKQRLLALVLIS